MDDQPTDAAKWWPGKLLSATKQALAVCSARPLRMMRSWCLAMRRGKVVTSRCGCFGGWRGMLSTTIFITSLCYVFEQKPPLFFFCSSPVLCFRARVLQVGLSTRRRRSRAGCHGEVMSRVCPTGDCLPVEEYLRAAIAEEIAMKSAHAPRHLLSSRHDGPPASQWQVQVL